jgi:carboxylesterase
MTDREDKVQDAVGADRGVFQEGNRTGFLLVHGLSGTPVEMRYIANGLAREGYTVSCPPLAGHCLSIEDLDRVTWHDWQASVQTALDQLSECCDHVFVGGLSMGAILALRIAHENPDKVHGTLLYAPTLWLDGWGVPWYARFFNLINDKFSAGFVKITERPPYGIKDQRLRALIAEALHSGDPSKAGFITIPGGPMLELRRLVRVVLKQLPEIRQPALVMHPRDDDRASLRNMAHLQKHLGGRVEAVVLEDSYHVITLDRQREVVLQKTLGFAQSVLAQRAQAGVQPQERVRPVAAA